MSEQDPAVARIEAALAAAGSEHEPPAGWEARVLAATREPRRTRWWWFAVPALVAAGILALWATRPRGAHEPSPLQLALAIEHGGPLVRGATAHVGDTLAASATGGAAHRAIWIYRDDQLVQACDAAAPCRLTLTSVGDYTVVAVASAAALEAPHGPLDTDVSALARTGASYQLEPVTVR